ncbi:hypothetical protein LSTR_LSTR009263 [Laodelphax striatellus]|uniref:Laminin IV type A domain-containing protein n=1 Tax=Laodelphax striatellus TaxID=195883 RepID=A0A482WXY2_LAOST|nr:hypothetical protein LSTR_LSTR009263 [Laodelphax striatellus]
MATAERPQEAACSPLCKAVLLKKNTINVWNAAVEQLLHRIALRCIYVCNHPPQLPPLPTLTQKCIGISDVDVVVVVGMLIYPSDVTVKSTIDLEYSSIKRYYLSCFRCKPGYFNMDEENEFGCTPCFCYGHSSVCNSAQGYSRIQIESNFGRHAERWTAKDVQNNNVSVQYLSETQVISVTAPDRDSVYFIAPDRFLGDQRASYNQDLEFKLRVGRVGQNPSVEDIVLEGAGKSIIQPIFGQGNQLPSTTVNTFKYRLHNDPDYGWQPRLSERDFMSVLANLTAIKIRGTYTPTGVGFLDEVRLESARRGAAGAPASWIEMCVCPERYVGQFCESCAPGSRHDPPRGGPFSPCVPCDCNSHADICDADSAQHTGDKLQRNCGQGFSMASRVQGNTPYCKVCPCPNQGACCRSDDVVFCLRMSQGYSGSRCDLCSDGYTGDPTGRNGPRPHICLENVEDRRCDRCKENKFNRQLGCVNCPACYNLVQDAADSHRSNLRQLDKILGDIAANPTVINDADFENKLREVMARVDRLWNEAKAATTGGDKTLLDQLNDLHARLDDVQVLMKQIHNWTEEARQQTEEAERNATEAELIIERARESLQGALDYLQTDGAAALKKAMERSSQFGQQSQQIQKEEYDNINWLAEKAVNVSTDAYELAKDTINQQKNTSDELKILASDLALARDLLDSANRLSAEVKGHVSNVHTEALDLYRDIYALTIPTVDTAAMRQDAQLLAEEMSGAEAMLELASGQQQTCDDLLADADAAKALADDAVTLGNKTLTEAELTLKTLQEFDSKIQESKDKASDALKQIPEIVQLIKEAEKKTTNAQEALAGAENNARSANAIAQDAQTKYAEQASKEADAIRKSAEVTKNEAGKLRDEADALASRVVVTATKVNDLEEQAKNDGRLTKLTQFLKDYEEELKRLKVEVDNIEEIDKSLPNKDRCYKRTRLEP